MMSEIVEAIRIKDSEDLPKEFKDISLLGKNERGRLAAVFEDGRRKEVSDSAASLLLKTLVSLDKAEVIMPSGASPETAVILEHIKQLETTMNQRLDGLEARIKRLETGTTAGEPEPDPTPAGVTPEIQAYIDKQIEQKTKSLNERITQLESEKSDLEKERDNLKQELAKAKGESPKTDELDRFDDGEDVVVDQCNGKFQSGYQFEGIEEKDDKKLIKLKDKSSDQTIVINPDRVKKPSEIKAADIVSVSEPPAPVAAPPERKRLEVRQSWVDRLRGRPARDYYIDDDGHPYYLDDSGRSMYVRDDIATERDNRGAGAVLALGGVAVGSVITWLLMRHSHGSVSVNDFNSLKISENKHHIQEMKAHVQEMKAIDAAKNAELKAIANMDAHVQREIWHSHKHDQQIFNGIQNRIDREHAQEMRAMNQLHARLQNLGAYWGLRYPWDWAAAKAGSLRTGGH